MDHQDFLEGFEEERESYLSDQLITYLGNKRALLPYISSAIDYVRKSIGREKMSAGDLFSGSGVVARLMKRYASSLFVNDLETYSDIINRCYLTNVSKEMYEFLSRLHERLNLEIEAALKPGWIAQLYAPRDNAHIQAGERAFYTAENAAFLDTARARIASLLPEWQGFFLAPLLSEASVHSNTSGVFKGFYKNRDGVGQFGGEGRNALKRIEGRISLPMPVFSKYSADAFFFREDANRLVRELPRLDLVYLDPPYNQHPYGSNYFMLNLLVTYQKPTDISAVSGIPANWNHSLYNQRQSAGTALFDLIENCPARFVLVSYNSEGFIGREKLELNLKKLGRLRTIAINYNTFRGCRNLRDRDAHVTEYLYLVEKRHGS